MLNVLEGPELRTHRKEDTEEENLAPSRIKTHNLYVTRCPSYCCAVTAALGQLNLIALKPPVIIKSDGFKLISGPPIKNVLITTSPTSEF